MAFKKYDIFFVIIIRLVGAHSVILFFLLEPTQVLWVYGHVLGSFLWNHHQVVSEFRHLKTWEPVSQIELKVLQVRHVVVTTSHKRIHRWMILLHCKWVKKYLSFLLSVIPSRHLQSQFLKTVSVSIESFVFDDS